MMYCERIIRLHTSLSITFKPNGGSERMNMYIKHNISHPPTRAQQHACPFTTYIYSHI